jgi:type VI secretion system protein VasI
MECSRIEDTSDRLACYDRLAQEVDEVRSGDLGKWRVNVRDNPRDDSRTITLYLVATNVSPPRDEAVFLFLRCRDGETTAHVTWNRALANGETMIRLGGGEAERVYWNVSSDSEATFYPGETSDFVQILLGNELLALQVNPRDSLPMTAVFELAGLDRAIEPLREGCPW